MQVPVKRCANQPPCSARLGVWASLLLTCCALWTAACKKPQAAPIDPGSGFVEGAAGRACKRDADCAGGVCVSALHIVVADSALVAPDGYCTLPCQDDSECGVSGSCSVPAGETRGECLANCSAERACRDGYQCVGANTTFGLSGSCQPRPETDQLEDGVVGEACDSNRDCGGGLCLGKTPVGESLPERYCSGRCLSDTDCGAQGGCLGFDGSGRPGTCLLRCETDADCAREGYRCRPASVDFDACYPAPSALRDHSVGKPCSEDAECGGEQASCAHSLPYFGGADHADAPGGYCTQACALDSDCGEGGQCISRGAAGALCFAVCEEQSDCREGYECVVHGRDHDDSERICVPWT